MISHGAKLAFYVVMGKPMAVSGAVYRLAFAPRRGCVRVHLGPGQGNYLPGWINVDANIFGAKPDVWADLRNALPFRTNTVDVFYSYHVIEHLPDGLLSSHFREMFRCLKAGGVIRVGVPNGDAAIAKFVEGDAAWFNDFPDSRTSIGGRFANFLLCRGEHLSILTRSYLEEIATGAGFKNFREVAPKSTRFPQFVDASVLALEQESCPSTPHTLIVEAQK